MLQCKKCKGKLFIDRVHSGYDHLETFCINCGCRTMYHPPSKFGAFGLWLEQIEKMYMNQANGK